MDYSTSELARITEIPRRTLYRWMGDGFLPVWRKTPGTTGPGQGDLHDKATAVWSMFLDEATKCGVTFVGQAAAQVFLYEEGAKPHEEGPLRDYQGPHRLGDSAVIVDYVRNKGFDLVALVLSGKLGYQNTPSRDRFTEVRLVPDHVAFHEVPQFALPSRRSLIITGFEPTHIIKSLLVISLCRLGAAFDYAAKRVK